MDVCSIDVLLRGVLSPFNGLNQSGYWSFSSPKGFVFFLFLKDMNKKSFKNLFFLVFCDWKQETRNKEGFCKVWICEKMKNFFSFSLSCSHYAVALFFSFFFSRFFSLPASSSLPMRMMVYIVSLKKP